MQKRHKPTGRGKCDSAMKNGAARLLLGFLLMLAFAEVGKAEEESVIERDLRKISFQDDSSPTDTSASYGTNALADGGFKTAMVSVGNKDGGVSLNLATNNMYAYKTVLFVAPAESEALKK